MSKQLSETRAETEERVTEARKELKCAMDELVREKGSFAEQAQTQLEMARQVEREFTKRGLERIAGSSGERLRFAKHSAQR